MGNHLRPVNTNWTKEEKREFAGGLADFILARVRQEDLPWFMKLFAVEFSKEIETRRRMVEGTSPPTRRKCLSNSTRARR